MPPRLLAASLPLFAACLATAADDAASKAPPALGAVAVQEVTTHDHSGYAMWVDKANQAFKAAGGPESYTRVYEAVVAGGDTGKLYAVRFGESAADIAKKNAAIMSLPERGELMEHLAQIRTLGPATMLKAVHAEGGYDGEWLFITDSRVKDEAAYVKALGELRGLFDAHGLKDLKINIFRVAAGRSDHSHEVVISAPTEDRCMAGIDAQTEPWMNAWLAGVSGARTVVSNGVFHEISK